MRNTFQSMLVWMLLVATVAGIYEWFNHLPESIDPAGYQEAIRRHATGDSAEDLIRFLDNRPLSETIE